MKKKVDFRQNNRNRFSEIEEDSIKPKKNIVKTRRKSNFNSKLKEVAQAIIDGDDIEDSDEFHES